MLCASHKRWNRGGSYQGSLSRVVSVPAAGTLPEREEAEIQRNQFGSIVRERDDSGWDGRQPGRYRDPKDLCGETAVSDGRTGGRGRLSIVSAVFEEVTVKEAAQLCGCSRKTIANRRNRILKYLNGKLQAIGIMGGSFQDEIQKICGHFNFEEVTA